MVVSQDGGDPSIDPKNTIIPIMGALKKGNLNFPCELLNFSKLNMISPFAQELSNGLRPKKKYLSLLPPRMKGPH